MEKYMRRAIELAAGGEGFVNPNPLVGAVIVKDGKVIGEGFHQRYGELHAERNALKSCTEDPSGADLVVTLEPCCHYGKNPPCTQAVIDSGIKRVFVGSYDPNPLVAGKGINTLREHGVEVVTEVLKEECDGLNEIFFHYITTNRPFVIMKAGITADGKIAAATGDSKWITNEKSRAHTHETRKRVAAILVGIGTVTSDDPMLSCRAENPSHPVRVVCDSKLCIPIHSRLVRTARQIPVYVATISEDQERARDLEGLGVHVIKTTAVNNCVDLENLMEQLGQMGVDSVLIEGGAEMHASALRAGIVNKTQFYVAPKIMGGDGKSAVGALGISLAGEAVQLKNPVITRFDDDILIEYEVK